MHQSPAFTKWPSIWLSKVELLQKQTGKPKETLDRRSSANIMGLATPSKHRPDEYCDMRVLIVDDSLTMRLIIEQTIHAQWPDADVIEAGDVPQAREALAAPDHGIDLVLLDLHLPEELGTVLLEEIRSNDALSEIPVLIITADADKPSMIKALGAGANGYLVKPVDEAGLRKEITRVLSLTDDAEGG
jgi:two-component system chemotaxis response regulator CheY